MLEKIHKNKLNAYTKNVGKNLRYYRKTKGYSQRYIAGILGVNKSVLSLYENAKVNVPVKYIYAIAVFLEVDIAKFFDLYEDKFKARRTFLD